MVAADEDEFEAATLNAYVRIRVLSGGYRLVQITGVQRTEDGCFYYVNAETSSVQTNKVFVVNNMVGHMCVLMTWACWARAVDESCVETDSYTHGSRRRRCVCV